MGFGELIGNMSWGHPTLAENLYVLAFDIAMTFLIELTFAWLILTISESGNKERNLKEEPITKKEVIAIIIVGNIMSGLLGLSLLWIYLNNFF